MNHALRALEHIAFEVYFRLQNFPQRSECISTITVPAGLLFDAYREAEGYINYGGGHLLDLSRFSVRVAPGTTVVFVGEKS